MRREILQTDAKASLTDASSINSKNRK